jgi:quercetin dioxygenase-like cupin family protein
VIVPDRVQLAMSFDAPVLAAEALSLKPAEWVPHFNQNIYEGAWTGVALRSVGGVETQLYPNPVAPEPFADTPTLAGLPGLRAALERFRCPLLSARLLSLEPGAIINEHRDYRLGWKDGEIRLHVPVITSPDVEFVLDGRAVALGPGEVWYLDLNLPHRVANRSSVTRIHLVIDCVVDDWLRELMKMSLNGGFVGTGVAFSALAVAPSAWARSSALRTAALTRSRFTPLVGRTLWMRAQGADIRVVLTEVADLRPARGDGDEDRFVLHFRAAKGAPRRSGVWRLSHRDLGHVDLFVSPIDRGVRTTRYEAVIDRSHVRKGEADG